MQDYADRLSSFCECLKLEVSTPNKGTVPWMSVVFCVCVHVISVIAPNTSCVKCSSILLCCLTRNKGVPRALYPSVHSTIAYGKRVCELINAFKFDDVWVPRHVSVNGVFSPRADLGSCLLRFTWGKLFLDSPLNYSISDESRLSGLDGSNVSYRCNNCYGFSQWDVCGLVDVACN